MRMLKSIYFSSLQTYTSFLYYYIHIFMFQKYKCHRMILAVASVVFETMFYGAFKEAKAGPDEPILLDNVSSESFVCAMR
jgi:BTB/POZ domain